MKVCHLGEAPDGGCAFVENLFKLYNLRIKPEIGEAHSGLSCREAEGAKGMDVENMTFSLNLPIWR